MQLPLVWAARAPPAPEPAPAPAPKPAPRRPRDPDACDCRHAEGTPIAHHLARGGTQEGCPGHAPKRTR